MHQGFFKSLCPQYIMKWKGKVKSTLTGSDDVTVSKEANL